MWVGSGRDTRPSLISHAATLVPALLEMVLSECRTMSDELVVGRLLDSRPETQ